MDKKFFIAAFVFAFFFLGVAFCFNSRDPISPSYEGRGLAKGQAIDIVQRTFPELKSFPSPMFPQRYVYAEEMSGGWNAAFVVEGNSHTYEFARCFALRSDGNMFERQFAAPRGSGISKFSGSFSPSRCLPVSEEPIIGGQTDEFGCLSPAGYSWCEQKSKCLRTWEEKCE